MNVQQIEDQARRELADEDHRARVDAAKQRIRANKGGPWWKRLLPFTIRIERRNV